jgi:hypothetical protein
MLNIIFSFLSFFLNNKKITSNCDGHGDGDGRRWRMTREIRGRMVYVFLELRKKSKKKK